MWFPAACIGYLVSNCVQTHFPFPFSFFLIRFTSTILLELTLQKELLHRLPINTYKLILHVALQLTPPTLAQICAQVAHQQLDSKVAPSVYEALQPAIKVLLENFQFGTGS